MGAEGEVKLSEGYLLPAKHILHVVPPEQFRKDTKDVLRKIYREILHTAVTLEATSIAFPSIGTHHV
jgi:O-acetyl-ADP-ribose deacetylase (regulator of RNase III)